MNVPITQQAITNGVFIRPWTDFFQYVKSYLLPKGSIVLFFGTIPQGFLECNGTNGTPNLTPPTGCKYGMKA
ncbi:MAG: hypothetical protein ACMV1B_05900 [Prevotella sp.]